ncbi:MAG: DegT/DnrJ/EryC1/StrS family aminotransferase [Steroidobacteraceae bacterium]
MAVRFLDLVSQYDSIKSEIDEAFADVIRDSAFISGPYVAQFERAFADYQRAPHCVACANGTDAIEIALEALGLPRGAEIIVPANTFIASSEAVTRAGFRVVFCDCDPQDYTLSARSLRQKITASTRAVVAVHLYGHPCDMDGVMRVASELGLKVLEDCAQAHGAEYKGRRVGTIGDVGTFSFYPGKNLGAYGDAGAIVTSDEEIALHARMIANHGRVAKYDHEFEGRNSRMDGLQGAVLKVKLAHLDKWVATRRKIAARYQRGLAGVGDLILPLAREWSGHVYHLYVVRTQLRDELREFLKARSIETGVHYPIALPKLAAYRYCGQAGEDFFANAADRSLLSLPIGEHMTDTDADEVISGCRDFYDARARGKADANSSTGARAVART